ncbi:MAG TPA: aminotransferase class I/II-fold pyridoxal phosphate-dependent enzyme, partial [Acidimicrobiia bacterium]
LRACGIAAVPLMLSPEQAMVPDLGAIEASITPRTRAIVLVTPNNPCGLTYPADLIEAAFDVANRHGIALILDETYKDFRSTTDPPHGLFARPDWRDTMVHLYSFSKMLSLAGYRAGSLVAAPHVLDAAAKLADCETIGAPKVAQEAVAFGLSPTLEPWVEDRRRAMCERVEHLDHEMAARPGGFEVVTSGAFFAYVRHPFGSEGATAVGRRLAVEHNLFSIPGDAFGPGQDRYLRLAFGNVDLDEITAAVARLAAAGH